MEEQYPVKNSDIVAREDEVETLLFNPADGNMLCINKTGMIVWSLCDGDHNVEAMVKEITDKYDVTDEKAQEDCILYLKELEGSGFIGHRI